MIDRCSTIIHCGRSVGMSRAILMALIGLFIMSCQGRPTDNEPIHLNPNMDDQEKFEAYEANALFEDNKAMRTPPAGTVARGALIMDSVFMTGLDADSVPVAENPLEITMPVLERGRERFDIYCSPCHGRTGDGRGIMVNRGYVPPPTYHSDRLRDATDGHIFNVITYGIRNMKGYKHQIPPKDRWAIIAYMRALQRSQNATLEDVPQEKRSQLRARDGS